MSCRKSHLSSPQTDKQNEHGHGNGLRYAVASMQGWRKTMEDTHCASTDLKDGFKRWSYFAVFDGHGGGTVAKYCAEHLMECITTWLKNSEDFNFVEAIK